MISKGADGIFNTLKYKKIKDTFHEYILNCHDYQLLYNTHINVCALIGQSTMLYCAGKLMEKSHVF